MKKLVILAACAMLAAVTNAAAVGWTLATGSASYANDAYQFFVIGQKGVESIATITALLDAGTSPDSYAFGSGKVGGTGTGMVAANAAGQPTLDAGTYTSFFVLFDSDAPAAGSSKYAVVSGAANLTKQVVPTAAAVTFASGNVSSTLSNASNWKSYGASSDVPEPTSGLLMLLGMAGLALRRKRA